MADGPSGPRLWVIDPSLRHAEEQGVAEVRQDWAGPSRLFRPALRPGDGPGRGTGYETDGVVLLGSAASVHDDEIWLGPLADWLRPILDGRPSIPLLAICFGHQLVAHLAGGRVGFIDPERTKIVGTRDTQLAGGRLLPGGRTLRVVVSHREEVKKAPTGYRVTARRPDALLDGLEHPTLPVFSFQFHPEARQEFAGRAGLAPTEIDDRLTRDGRSVLAAFRQWVTAASR